MTCERKIEMVLEKESVKVREWLRLRESKIKRARETLAYGKRQSAIERQSA